MRKLHLLVAGVAGAAAAVAMVLAFGFGLFGMQSSAATAVNRDAPVSDVPAKAAGQTKAAHQVAEAPAGGPREGIKVHGHWTIEVRQPDGALVSQQQFENTLLSGGASALAKYLARANSVGFWQVMLDSNEVGGGVCGTPETPVTCVLFETASSDSPISGHTFKTLSASVPTSGPNTGKFVLSGTATATVDGSVGRVGTGYNICSYGDATPCGGAAIYDYFTSTVLSAPVAVIEGQSIMVTVVISFS